MARERDSWELHAPTPGDQELHLALSLSQDRLRPQGPGQQSHVDPGRLTAWAPQSAGLGPLQLGPRQQRALPPQPSPGMWPFPWLAGWQSWWDVGCGEQPSHALKAPSGHAWKSQALWGLPVPGHVTITWFSPSWAPPPPIPYFLPALPPRPWPWSWSVSAMVLSPQTQGGQAEASQGRGCEKVWTDHTFGEHGQEVVPGPR